MQDKIKDNDIYSYYCCLTNFLNGKEISDIKRHEDIILTFGNSLNLFKVIKESNNDMEIINQEVIDAIGFDADKAKAMTDIVVKKKEEDEKNHYIKNILPKTLENIFDRITEEINKGNSCIRYNFPPEAYKQQIITKILENKKFKIEYNYHQNDSVISW